MHGGRSVLLASDYTYKELRSHHSILTNKKLNILKNQYWIHKRGEDTDKPLSSRLERQVNVERQNLLEQRLRRGYQCQGRNSWTIIDKLLEAQCRWPWKLKTLGDPVIWAPTISWDLPPRVQPGSHTKCLRKITSSFWHSQEKRNHLKILQSTQHSNFPNKACPQG